MRSETSTLGVKKILIIEDNKEISENIKEYFELEDFQIDQAFAWDTGLEKGLSGNYDLILLDVMLPEINGFNIAEKFRRKIETPIIMMTAKDAIDDKLKGFEVGVVDYIVKPFDLRELEARVNNTLKIGVEIKALSIGDVMVDLEAREFIRSWEEVHITSKEFLIVEFLINSANKVISRTDIIEHVWGGEDLFSADGKLDVYISTIRKKLWKDLIKTIKWVWYKINI